MKKILICLITFLSAGELLTFPREGKREKPDPDSFHYYQSSTRLLEDQSDELRRKIDHLKSVVAGQQIIIDEQKALIEKLKAEKQ